MPFEKKSVNLFRKPSLEKRSSLQLFLGWLATIGKAIIIITNVITISAFAYRVYLDQRKADLKDKLSAQERALVASLPFEREFRSWQKRLDLLKRNYRKKSLLSYLTLVKESVPQEVSLQEIAISPQEIDCQLVADNGFSVSLFAVNLASKDIKEFSLRSVRYSQGEYQVGISAIPN